MERELVRVREKVSRCLGKARGGSKGDDGSSSEITCNHSGGGRMCTGKGILKGVGVYTYTFLRWGRHVMNVGFCEPPIFLLPETYRDGRWN